MRKVIIVILVSLVTTLAAGCDDDTAFVPVEQSLRRAIDEAGLSELDAGPMPSAAKATLGQMLMFDRELSGNRDISCATCHHPLLHTADGLSLPIGTGGVGLGPSRILGEGRRLVPRNAPDVFNRGAPEWKTMLWDGRVAGTAAEGFTTPAGVALPAGLESVSAAHAMFPVTSPDEMRGVPGDVDVFGNANELALIPADDPGAIWDALADRLLAIPEYVDMFGQAFPHIPTEEIGFQHAANAIAAFETAFWTFLGSPWDRYLAGDSSALSQDAKRGALLFLGPAGCVACHSGNLLTDQEHHNIGVPQIGPGKGAEAPLDFGRGRETGLEEDRFAFRTPPLRNVALTGPWMHNGAYTTLEAAVRHHLDPATALRHYDVSQLAPDLRETFQDDDETIESMLSTLDTRVAAPLEVSDAEVNELLAFLEALTDPAAADLRDDIPDSVPSGLPVGD
jgi:cytochrome c peroxidase